MWGWLSKMCQKLVGLGQRCHGQTQVHSHEFIHGGEQVSNGGKGQNWKSINVKRKQTGSSEHGRRNTATYQETGLEEHANVCVCDVT